MGSVNSVYIKGKVLEDSDTKTDPKVEEPKLYQVVLLNDDYTPMEFVVLLLQKFFGFDEALAMKIMWDVHTRGRSACGVYQQGTAEAVAAQVNDYARQHEHPLLCVIEEV